ncbi:hypothetical protein [Dendronalium sp. ChiSLP03b]|uniref:hypothetical protein n=1 Tax=Dendronalium sp. ChiSLP03b TaxID=3075381 RepID=UPI002AD478C6|nr:hypothetical protein [Dendronalium sp. ChiSLP03b]MDZ8206456.1 hypothetical protein [Dendronalium sp. ChiSLP03b]
MSAKLVVIRHCVGGTPSRRVRNEVKQSQNPCSCLASVGAIAKQYQLDKNVNFYTH